MVVVVMMAVVSVSSWSVVVATQVMMGVRKRVFRQKERKDVQ